MGIVIGSAVIPIALSTCWSRLTGEAMMGGGIGGTALALIVWLAISSQHPGGLYPPYFFINTGKIFAIKYG